MLVGGIVLSTRIADGASVATPTPPSSATSVSTATALPAGTLRILVFNDLNGDGIRASGEPGLANWHINQGCGDVILPLTTDANGEAITRPFGGYECLSLVREFGWLPTGNPISIRVPADWDTTKPFTFALHDLGRTVMELRGEAISGGLPMVQGAPGIEEPFRSCGHLFFESVRPTGTYAVVIVEGADTHAGCLRPGESVVPSSDGVPPTPAPPVSFVPASTVATSWVSNGDSMRFLAAGITDAWVLDQAAGRVTQHCAEVRSIEGFVPPGTARVFVLSDRARPGCGAAGRMVRLFRDGLALEPAVEWRAGDISQTLPQFEVRSPADTRVAPPNAGTAGLLGADRHGARPNPWPLFCGAIAIAVLAIALRSSARRY